MYDMLFLGSLFPKNEEIHIYKNTIGNMQNAANLLQWDYIEGLESVSGQTISIMTRVSVGTFPKKYKEPMIKTHYFKHSNDSKDLVVGFYNIPIIRQITYPYAANKFLFKWAKEKGSGQKILIAYSYLNSVSISFLKKKFPHIKVILIILDLPIFTNLDHRKSLLYKVIRYIENQRLIKAINYIDGIVPITKYMLDKLDPEHKKKSIVIEGMVKQKKRIKFKKDCDFFQIAYTGTLTEIYGIMDLVNAVHMMEDSNIRLVICGGGETSQRIKKIAAIDKRIIFRGAVTIDEAYRLQCSSNLLVNPRKNDNEYTKYSFPSKILQYMSTGNPVLCYRLDGFPAEYDNYLLYVGENETLENAIHRVKSMSSDELEKIGTKALYFVNENKTNIEQVKKLWSFIRSL